MAEDQIRENWRVLASELSSKVGKELSAEQIKAMREGFRDYEKKAKKGDLTAQFIVGNCYEQGLIVKQNFKKAIDYYLPAAEKGNAEAQAGLGRCFDALSYLRSNEDGLNSVDRLQNSIMREMLPRELHPYFTIPPKTLSTEYEDKAATYWYTKAAEQNNKEARIRLGLEKKASAPPVQPGQEEYDAAQRLEDLEERIGFYKAAASKGHLGAMEALDNIYTEGLVERDMKVSFSYRCQLLEAEREEQSITKKLDRIGFKYASKFSSSPPEKAAEKSEASSPGCVIS